MGVTLPPTPQLHWNTVGALIRLDLPTQKDLKKGGKRLKMYSSVLMQIPRDRNITFPKREVCHLL